MKIIISAGGTGGHIYPAIAIAHALKQDNAAHDILFVGAQGKMEMQEVALAGYPIIGLNIQGIERRRLWRNLVLPYKLLSSLWKAKQLITQFNPAIVIGTGGYASAAILYAATYKKIPTLIQEQNAYPGLTNRMLAKRVNKICVAYEKMERYFPPNKIAFTGNPLRQAISQLASKRQAAHLFFQCSPHQPCLLVLGGSQGAYTINQSILQALPALLKADIQIIWLTGKAYFAKVQSQLASLNHPSIKLFPFLERMELALSVADIVVSRAGALAISELCIAQKPTIFIPSPHVTADHQTKNILPLLAKEAAIVLSDQEAPQKLGKVIIDLLRDTDRQNTLMKNMQLWARPHATQNILSIIHQLANPT